MVQTHAWLNPRIQNRGYRGTTDMEELPIQRTNYKLYVDFSTVAEGGHPSLFVLFKGNCTYREKAILLYK